MAYFRSQEKSVRSFFVLFFVVLFCLILNVGSKMVDIEISEG